MREALANKYIKGAGIEIGGRHFPLPVPAGAYVTYIDHIENDPESVVNSMVDDAEVLTNVPLLSQDFIIANHVLEHCHDPLGTLLVWTNRLKANGIIYAAIPEKTKTFDKDRAVTPLAHLRKDLDFPTERVKGDVDHYRDWHFHVDGLRGAELAARVQLDVESNANIHFHVWDKPAMLEMMNYMDPFLIVEECLDNGAEVIFILRKKWGSYE